MRNGFIITSSFVDLTTINSHCPLGNSCTSAVNTFKIKIDKNLNFEIHWQRSLFEAHVERSRHAGRDGGQGGAADDCTSDVAAGRRRMALATVAWASLKIFHFLISETFSGTKCSWISIIGGHQCSCFNFGSWQGWLDEEMALDVSDGPAYSGLVSWSDRRMDLCLKRPSFNCLIHFYKRCVSSLAQMGRSPWVRSGWVSVLSVTTFFIQG